LSDRLRMEMNILSNGTNGNDLSVRSTTRSINNTCSSAHSYILSLRPIDISSYIYMCVGTEIDKQNFLSILIEHNDFHSGYQ